jgi:hypothetical protein
MLHAVIISWIIGLAFEAWKEHKTAKCLREESEKNTLRQIIAEQARWDREKLRSEQAKEQHDKRRLPFGEEERLARKRWLFDEHIG